MKIAEPASWGDQRPAVPQGYAVTAIATDLQIPRQTLVLPNGDILVAEGAAAARPTLTPKDIIAGFIKARGHEFGQGRQPPDPAARRRWRRRLRVTHRFRQQPQRALRAGAGRRPALRRQPGRAGPLRLPRRARPRASGPPVKVTDLPSAINHHWTKALAASPDGRFLYVGIGSNSNITERGMPAEVDRARVWQVDAQTGAHRPFATGLRNPTALTIQPGTGQLWAVGERARRDRTEPCARLPHLGPRRRLLWLAVQLLGPKRRHARAAAGSAEGRLGHPSRLRLGSHVATLGVAFSAPAMGAPFADGVFVGEHGSWNRNPPVGYKVIFVPFRDGRPAGPPVDFVTGFMGEDGKTRGRPVGVTVDPRGALIVADDLSNTLWRVTPVAGVAAGASAASSAPPR